MVKMVQSFTLRCNGTISLFQPPRPGGSVENEALENEDRSTKHPKLENEAPYLENGAPYLENEDPKILKTKHPKLENEDP